MESQYQMHVTVHITHTHLALRSAKSFWTSKVLSALLLDFRSLSPVVLREATLGACEDTPDCMVCTGREGRGRGVREGRRIMQNIEITSGQVMRKEKRNN